MCTPCTCPVHKRVVIVNRCHPAVTTGTVRQLTHDAMSSVHMFSLFLFSLFIIAFFKLQCAAITVSVFPGNHDRIIETVKDQKI